MARLVRCSSFSSGGDSLSSQVVPSIGAPDPCADAASGETAHPSGNKDDQSLAIAPRTPSNPENHPRDDRSKANQAGGFPWGWDLEEMRSYPDRHKEVASCIEAAETDEAKRCEAQATQQPILLPGCSVQAEPIPHDNRPCAGRSGGIDPVRSDSPGDMEPSLEQSLARQTCRPPSLPDGRAHELCQRVDSSSNSSTNVRAHTPGAQERRPE